MEIGQLLLLVLPILFGLSLIAIPYYLLYLLHKWLTSKGYRNVGPVLIISFSIFLIYSIYTAFYPTDSFYLSEFKDVTLREAPRSAMIIKKDASYPDFHGDYCSASLIALSNEDYSSLLTELINDERITEGKAGGIIGSNELHNVMGNLRTEQIIHNFTPSISGRENHYLYIGFFDDNKTIVISVCVI